MSDTKKVVDLDMTMTISIKGLEIPREAYPDCRPEDLEAMIEMTERKNLAVEVGDTLSGLLGDDFNIDFQVDRVEEKEASE